MKTRPIGLVLAAIVITVLGCAPARAPETGQRSGSAAGEPQRSTSLTMLVRYEPPSLAVKALRDAGAGISSTTRLFNAQLDMDDGEGGVAAYLAEELPRLNTDSWRVLPDGRMETSYRLRPNLTWHDGKPLTADDFVFAWRVYTRPLLGVGSQVLSLMEEVSSTDPRSVMIRWRQPYPDAGGLRMEFQPLPRHLLGDALDTGDPEGFVTLPFWTNEYVGVGPYRLTRWEPGALLEAAAFDGHALGRPKIDRLIVRFVPDENTALTNLLAGEGQYATGRSLRFEHAQVLKREWTPTAKGSVLLTPDTPRYTSVQFRTDFVNPQALHDLRVRKALVTSTDRQALNDAIFDGAGAMIDMFIAKHTAYDRVPDVERVISLAERAITRYPFDLRRAEEYFAEAGFRRGNDGVLINGAGERMSMEVWADAGPQYEKEQAIMADIWKGIGVETKVSFVPPARLRDNEWRSSFPALHTTSAGRLESMASVGIPTPQNRWGGSNRGSWSNAEYDRLWDAFNTTLEPSTRGDLAVQMLKMGSEELPMWVLYHNQSVSAHVAGVKGPNNSSLNSDTWNIYLWEVTQ